MTKPLVKSRQRLIIVFTLMFLGMVLLCFKVGWVQIVKGDEYSKKASLQQTKDIPIHAKRGTIYDRNNTKLAISAPCYSVWVRPAKIGDNNEGQKKKLEIEETASKLAEILGSTKDDIKKKITQEKPLIKIAKYQDKKVAEKIRKTGFTGVEIAEDVKRYYPIKAFASHLLGSVADDSNGLSGIEKEYNNYLSGTEGRWIKDTAADGKSLPYGSEQYYAPEDGVSLELTIDEVMQHYVEKAIEKAYKKTSAKKVECLMMDPKTGDILAMATYPDFDPNDAKTPADKTEQSKILKMTSEQKAKYWSEMWRNPMVSDTYEPGSTFKLITLGAALEEGVCTPKSHYICAGTVNVEGSIIKCWRSKQPHGIQTVKEATGNSCNPVFVQLALKLGKKKYYNYLENFGLTETTGIDYPGETNSILLSENNLPNSDLARMGFGQSLNVTPIQLLTAISSYANDGKLMEPHIVKAFLDENGKPVKDIRPQVIRRVVSKETAAEVLDIMKYACEEGGAKIMHIDGYDIGGKTGTAQKTINGKISKQTYSSVVAVAPTEDPKFTLLCIVDSPKGVQYGSATAGPAAKDIMQNVLRYLNVKQKQVTDTGAYN